MAENDELKNLATATPEEVSDAIKAETTVSGESSAESPATTLPATTATDKGFDPSKLPGYTTETPEVPPTGQLDTRFWDMTESYDDKGNSTYYNNQTLNEGVNLDEFKSRTFLKGLDDGFTYTGFDSTWERSQEAQGKMGKLANGAVRFVGDTMFNVAQGFVMFGGAASALAQGEMSKLFDNDVANYLDETQAEFDKIFGIKRGGEQSFMDSATNVFAEDILGAASFLAGAVVSEVAMAAITAGTFGAGAPLLVANTASIAARSARLMKGILNGAKALKPAKYLDDLAKQGIIGATKQGAQAVRSAATTMTREAVAEGIEQATKQTTKQKLSAAARQGRQLLTGAGFEAGVEARHMLNEAVEDHKQAYEQMHGAGSFTEEMAEEFREKIQPHANAVFGANLALVGASNMMMFPKIFGAGARSSIKLPKFIDTSTLTPKQLKRAMKVLDIKDATKLPKIIDARRVKGVGRIYRNAAPLRTALYEGAVEEGMQGILGSSTKDYIADMYDPAGVEHTANYLGSFFDAFAEQYTSAEGLKEVGLGMLMGFTGLPNIMIGNMVKYKNPDGSTYTPRFVGGMTESRKELAEEDGLANRIIRLHEKNGDVNAILRNEIQHSVLQANLARRYNEAAATGNFRMAKDIEADQIFAHATSKIFTGRKEDAKAEYKQLLDEMSDAEYRELLGEEGLNMPLEEVQARKQKVYENYVALMDEAERSYQKAKDIYKGDDVNIHIGVSHLMYNIKDRDRREQAIAESLSKKMNRITPGQIRAASHLQRVANISDAQIQELREVIDTIEAAEQNIDTTVEREKLQALRARRQKIESALRKRANKMGAYNWDVVRFREDLLALEQYHEELKQFGVSMPSDASIMDDWMDLQGLQHDRMVMIAEYDDLLKEGGVERFFGRMQQSVQSRLLMPEDKHNKKARTETALADEEDKNKNREAQAAEEGQENNMPPEGDLPDIAVDDNPPPEGGELYDEDGEGDENGPRDPDEGGEPGGGVSGNDGSEGGTPGGGLTNPDGTDTTDPAGNAGSLDNRYGDEGELPLKTMTIAQPVATDDEGNPVVANVTYDVFKTGQRTVVVVNYEGAALPFFTDPASDTYGDGFYPFLGYAKDGSMIGHTEAKSYFGSQVLEGIANTLNDRLSGVLDGTNDFGVLNTTREALRRHGINSNEGLRLPIKGDVNFQTYVAQAAYEFLQTFDQNAAEAFHAKYRTRKQGENRNDTDPKYKPNKTISRKTEPTGNGGWRKGFSPNWDGEGGLRLRGALTNGGGSMEAGATDALINGIENGEVTIVPHGEDVQIMYNGNYVGRLNRAEIEGTEGVDIMEDGRTYKMKVGDVAYRKGVRPSVLIRDSDGRPVKVNGQLQYKQVKYSLDEIFDTDSRKQAVMDIATVRMPKGVPTIEGFTTGEVYDWPSDTLDAHKRMLVGRTVVMFKDANGKEHFMVAEMPQAGPEVANAMWYAIQTALVVSGVKTAQEVGMTQQSVEANVRSLQEMYGLTLFQGDAVANSEAVYNLISQVLGYQNDDSNVVHTGTQRRSGKFVEGVTEAWRFGSDFLKYEDPFQFLLYDHNSRADANGTSRAYDAAKPENKDAFIKLMSQRQLNLSYALLDNRADAGLPIDVQVSDSGAITYSDMRPAFDWAMAKGTNSISTEVKGINTQEGVEAYQAFINRRGNVPLQVTDANGNDALVFDFPFLFSLEVQELTPIPTDANETGNTDGLSDEELLKRALELEDNGDNEFYSPSAASDELAPEDDGTAKGELSDEEDAEMVADLYSIAGMSSKNAMDAINIVRGRLAAQIIKHNMSAARKKSMTANDMVKVIREQLMVELNNLNRQRKALEKAGKATANTDAAISQFEKLFEAQNFEKVARLAMIEIISHTQGIRVENAKSVTDAFNKLGYEVAVNEQGDTANVGSSKSDSETTETADKDEDSRDEAEQEEFKVFEDGFTFTIDPNDTMGKELRLRMMTLKEPDLHPGNKTVFGSSPEQQKSYVDYKRLQTQVLNAVSNHDYSTPGSRNYNYKELAKILEQHSDVYPGLKSLLAALDDTVTISENKQANDWAIGKRQLLQTQLVRFAAKESAEFITFKLRDKKVSTDEFGLEGGRPSTTYQFSSNQQGLNEFAVTQMFQGLVARGFFEYTETGELQHNQEKFKEIVAKMDAIVSNRDKTAEDKARIIAGMLSVNTGVTVSPSTLLGSAPNMPWNKVQMELGQTRRVETALGSMRNYFVQGSLMTAAEAKAAKELASKTPGKNPAFDPDIMNRANASARGLRQFVGIAAANSKQLVQNTSRDGRGNLRQQFVAPKMLTERLKDVRSNPQLYTQELENNALYNILKGRNVTDVRNLMQVDYFGGITNYDDISGLKEFHDMELEDRSVAQFLAYVNNAQVTKYASSRRGPDGKMVKSGKDKMVSKHFVPTLSDKSTMPAINLPQLDLNLRVPRKFDKGFEAGIQDIDINEYVNVDAVYNTHVRHIVNAELKRIKEARIQNSDTVSTLTAAQRQAKGFIMLPKLNRYLPDGHISIEVEEQLHREAAALIANGLTENLKATLSGLEGSFIEYNEEKNSYNFEYIKPAGGSAGKKLNDAGLVIRNVTGMSASDMKSDGNTRQMDALAATIAHFVTQDYAYSVNAVQLFAGELGVFHKKEGATLEETAELTLNNVGKRFAAWIAPGNVLVEVEWKSRGTVRSNRTFNIMAIKDKVSKAANYEYLKKLGLSNEQLAAYEEIEATDGSEWVHYEEHLSMLYAEGKMDRRMFEGLLNRCHDIMSGKDTRPLDVEELAFFQPVKPVTAGIRNGQMTYIKSAQFPLVPDVTRTSEMNKLLEFMDKNNVQRAVHLSAYKAGSPFGKNPHKGPEALNIYGEDGAIEIDEAKAKEVIVRDIPRHFMRVQQEVPVGRTKEKTHGSQAAKLFMSGLTTIESGFKVWSPNGVMDLSGTQLYQHYMDARRDELEARSEMFANEMGLEYVNGSFRETPEFRKKLADRLVKEGLARNYEVNEIAELQYNEQTGEFMTPLWATANADRINSLMRSLYRKAVIKPMMLGFSGPIRPEAGIKERSVEDLTASELKSIAYVTDKNGKRKWDGKKLRVSEEGKPDQILLPWKFAGKMQDFMDDNGNIDMSRLPEELLQVFAYRIPGQKKASSGSFEIVGFLPPSMGDTLIVPEELVGRVGQDYDIDKMFGMMYEHRVVKRDGKKHLQIIRETNTQDPTPRQRQAMARNRQLDSYHASVRNTDPRVQRMLHTPISNGYSEKVIENLGLQKTELSSTLPYSLRYNHLKAENARSGKRSISVFATHAVLHAQLNSVGVSPRIAKAFGDKIESYGVKIPRNPGGVVLENYDRLGKHELIDTSFMSDIVADRETMTVQEQFSALINHAVDNESDQLLEKLGITEETWFIWTGLTHMGYNVETIAMFVQQPIVQQFISRAKEGKRIGKKGDRSGAAALDAMFSELEKLVKVDEGDNRVFKLDYNLRVYPNKQDMYEQHTGGKIERFTVDQQQFFDYQLLKQLSRLQSLDNSLSTMVQALKFDTRSPRSQVALDIQLAKAREFTKMQMQGRGDTTVLFEGDEWLKTLENTVAGQVYLKMEATSNVVSLEKESLENTGVYKWLVENTEKRALRNPEGIIKGIRMYAHVKAIEEATGRSAYELRSELMLDKDRNLVKRIFDLAKKSPEVANNPFLALLELKPATKFKPIHTIEFNGTKQLDTMSMDANVGFLALARSKDPAVRKLAEDLVVYSMINGHVPAARSFSKYVPAELREKVAPSSTERAMTLPGVGELNGDLNTANSLMTQIMAANPDFAQFNKVDEERVKQVKGQPGVVEVDMAFIPAAESGYVRLGIQKGKKVTTVLRRVVETRPTGMGVVAVLAPIPRTDGSMFVEYSSKDPVQNTLVRFKKENGASYAEPTVEGTENFPREDALDGTENHLDLNSLENDRPYDVPPLDVYEDDFNPRDFDDLVRDSPATESFELNADKILTEARNKVRSGQSRAAHSVANGTMSFMRAMQAMYPSGNVDVLSGFMTDLAQTLPSDLQPKVRITTDSSAVTHYNKQTNVITFNPNLSKKADLVHEMTHALTAMAVANKLQMSKGVQEAVTRLEKIHESLQSDGMLRAMGIDPADYKQYKRGNSIYRRLAREAAATGKAFGGLRNGLSSSERADLSFFLNKENRDKMYGLTSVDEMIAETLTNPQFAEQLNKLKRQGKQTWLQRVMELIRDVLSSILPNVNINSLAAEVVENSVKVMKGQARQQGRASLENLKIEGRDKRVSEMMQEGYATVFSPTTEQSAAMKAGDIETLRQYKKKRIEEFEELLKRFKGVPSVTKAVNQLLERERREAAMLNDDSVTIEAVLDMADRELTSAEAMFNRINLETNNLEYVQSRLQNVYSMVEFYERFRGMVSPSSETRAQLRDIQGRAANLREDWFDISSEVLRQYAKQKFKGTPLEAKVNDESFKIMDDVGTLSSLFQDASRQGRIELSYLDMVIREANERQQARFNDMYKEYMEQSKRFKDTSYFKTHGFEGIMEVDADGNPTNRLINPISPKFYEDSAKLYEEARQTGDYTKYNKWQKENTINLDVSKLYEATATGYVRKPNPVYMLKLEKEMGKEVLNEILTRQDKAMQDYHDRRQAQIDIIEMDEADDLARERSLREWEATYSPFMHYRYATGRTRRPRAAKNLYLKTAPKATNNGQSTGYVDSRYTELMQDPDALAFYNYTRQLMRDMTAMLPATRMGRDVHLWKNGLMLPAMRRTLMEEVKNSSSKWDTLSSAAMAAITSSDEELEATTIDPVTGEPRTQLPTYFIKNLPKGENIETDLDRSIGAFMIMATTFDARNEVEDIVAMTSAVMNSHKMEIAHTNGMGQRIKNRFGKDIGMSSVQSKSNVARSVQAVTNEFYGRRAKKKGSSALGRIAVTQEQKNKKRALSKSMAELRKDLDNGTISELEYQANYDAMKKEYDETGQVLDLGKLLRQLMQFVQLKGMGWNIAGATTNTVFGTVSVMRHAEGQTDFTPSEARKAQAIMLHSTLNHMTLNTGYTQTETAGKILAMMTNLDVLKDFTEVRYDPTKAEAGGNQRKGLSKLRAYEIQRSSEYFVYGQAVVAKLLATKVDGKSLWEHMDKDGVIQLEGYRPGEPKFFELQRSIDQMNKLIHGNYDPNSPIAIKQTLLGPMLMQFRTWLPEAAAQRFGKEVYDPYLGRVVKGTYRTMFSRSTLSELGFKILPLMIPFYARRVKIEGLSKVDEENVRKFMATLRHRLQIALLILFLKSLKDDEDDENNKRLLNYGLNIARRVETDISFFGNAGALSRILQEPAAVLGLAKDVDKITEAAWLTLLGDDEIPTGIYAGDNRLLHHTMRLPVLNAVRRQVGIMEQEYNT